MDLLVEELGLKVTANRYVLVERVPGGQGARSYFGRDLVTGSQVFVKFLLFPRSDSERARFQHEVFALEMLNRFPSPPVPKLLSSGSLFNGDVLYAVTQRLDGVLLSTWLDTQWAHARLDERLEILHRVSSALTGAPYFEHRDFHPGNIMLLPAKPDWHSRIPEHQCVILDWGQAYNPLTAQFEDSPEFAITLYHRVPKEIAGSFYSLPPDVFAPSRSAYHPGKHDAWSFGLLLYKVLTGKDALHFDGIGDYVQALKSGQLEQTLARCTATLLELPTSDKLVLAGLFSRLTRIDPAERAGAGLAARILWDIRIETLTPSNHAEAQRYLDNPHDFRPTGGWQHSDWPDFD